MNKRLMVPHIILYSGGTAPIEKKKLYTFTTQATERQIADDLATELGVTMGEGFMSIIDISNHVLLKKLEFPL